MSDKTMDERLEEAIDEAFDDWEVEKNEQNINAVRELVKLEIDKRRMENDYYCRATEVDNETQKLDNEANEKTLKNRLLGAVPDFIKTGVSALAMLGITIIAKRYEEKGYLVKIPRIVELVLNKLGFGK